MVLIADRGGIVKNRVLRAEGSVVAGQPSYRGRFQGLVPVSVQIANGHEDTKWLILNRLAAEAEQGLDQIVGVFPCGRLFRQLPVVLAVRMVTNRSRQLSSVPGTTGVPSVQRASAS